MTCRSFLPSFSLSAFSALTQSLFATHPHRGRSRLKRHKTTPGAATTAAVVATTTTTKKRRRPTKIYVRNKKHTHRINQRYAILFLHLQKNVRFGLRLFRASYKSGTLTHSDRDISIFHFQRYVAVLATLILCFLISLCRTIVRYSSYYWFSQMCTRWSGGCTPVVHLCKIRKEDEKSRNFYSEKYLLRHDCNSHILRIQLCAPNTRFHLIIIINMHLKIMRNNFIIIMWSAMEFANYLYRTVTVVRVTDSQCRYCSLSPRSRHNKHLFSVQRYECLLMLEPIELDRTNQNIFTFYQRKKQGKGRNELIWINVFVTVSLLSDIRLKTKNYAEKNCLNIDRKIRLFHSPRCLSHKSQI